MNTLWKKTAVLALAGTMAVTGMTGCSKKLDGSKTVTTVNGDSIPLGVLSLTVRYQQASTDMMYQTYFGSSAANMWDTVADEESGQTYGEQTIDTGLESLENMIILRQHADDYEVVISDEEQEKITEAAKSFMEANDDATIAALGVDQEMVELYLSLYYYNQKMYDPMVADVDTDVSDDEAAQTGITYVAVAESTAADSEEDDEETLADTLDAKTKAELILESVLAEENADMDALAKEIDENLSATETHFTTNPAEDEEDTSVPEELQEAAKNLSDGEVNSELIEVDGTYYILRLDATRDEEATESHKEEIANERQQEAYEGLIDEWREDSEISRDEKVLEKLTLTNNEKFSFKIEETETTEEEESDEGSADDSASEDSASDEETATDDESAVDTGAGAEETAGGDEEAAE